MEENTFNQQQDTSMPNNETFQGGEANPNMQGQYDSNMQGHYNPNMQGQYNPNMQGQYNPNMQDQYNPNMQGGQSNYQQYRPIPDHDHTNKYEADDIAQNKSIAMLCYLMGPFGIIMAGLLSQTSPYAMFHVRQSTRFLVLNMLCVFAMSILFWTFIVPIAAGILLLAIFIAQIVTVVQIAQGKAVIPFILRSIKFL